MVQKLSHADIRVARQIYQVFQMSYAIEADLLGVRGFPPLQRPLKDYQNTDHVFWGYFAAGTLAGVIEVEQKADVVDIHSLVVHPAYFRRGIGQALVNYVLDAFADKVFLVETGVDNAPACALYEKVGFVKTKDWHTALGIHKVEYKKGINTAS